MDGTEDIQKEIEKHATELNEAADFLNDRINALDTWLTGLGIGAAVWVPRTFTNPAMKGQDFLFGYARRSDSKRFSLVIAPCFQNSNSLAAVDAEKILATSGPFLGEYWTGTKVALIESPRWMRIKCVEMLPDLLNLIRERLLSERDGLQNSFRAIDVEKQKIESDLKDTERGKLNVDR